MTKKSGVMAFVAAANMAAKQIDTKTVTSIGRARSQSRGVRTPKFVQLEDMLFSEMERNQASQVFSDEEIERMAHIFGLSAEEVAALYRLQD